MAETKRMTAEQVVSYLLEGEEGLDFLRESLRWLVQQLMEAEVSELIDELHHVLGIDFKRQSRFVDMAQGFTRKGRTEMREHARNVLRPMSPATALVAIALLAVLAGTATAAGNGQREASRATAPATVAAPTLLRGPRADEDRVDLAVHAV
ncbi:MAG: hypothetical protein ABR583_13075 [Gaiellaceae bacterium]